MTTEDEKPFPEHLRMPATPVLETERLILRPPRERDVPTIQRRFPQWEVVRWLHAEVPWPYPDDGAAQHWRRMQGEMERREKSHWAITLKGDDDLIGLIVLWADDGETRDQRGFWLDPAFWGRGLMTEAANRVTDYALVELGWPHLWLNNAEANVASHRVKEKQGAKLIDRTPRDYVSGPGTKVTWLLTREAWLPGRPSPPAGEGVAEGDG
ncbi:MAG TPA: GNAT family N-acetyltransferase [Caulobacteraceae bacterium]|jgi:RimJ/RimL family protein N-acetyltransferase|nr:GNAT family N-acetyltransferase [Caulobacteraceae bacterium]